MSELFKSELFKLVDRILIDEKRALVASFLKRSVVERHMDRMHLTRTRVQGILLNLTDDEIMQLAEKIERTSERQANSKRMDGIAWVLVCIFLVLFIGTVSTF